MKMPEYHMRIVADTMAAVFRIELNAQRRIRWERCASISLDSGEITMLEGAEIPPALRAYCETGLACLVQAKNENSVAHEALKAMGHLAETVSNLGASLDDELFEMLIWAEADLKNGLVVNKGLALLAEDDQEKYILQGQHYMNQGEYARAEAEYLKAQKSGSNRANVYNFLAISLARQAKPDEAAAAINKSILANAGNVGFMIRGAQYNLDAGNPGQAQTYINKLSETPGLANERILQISRLALRAEMKDLARTLAERLVNTGNNDEHVLEHLVNIVTGMTGEKEVFNIIRQHVGSMPNRPKLKVWYLRALIHNGDLEMAQRAAKDWISAEDRAFQAHFQLGRVYLAMQKPRRALRALAVAADISPHDAPCQKLIADACLSLDDLAGAAEASENACKLQPDNENFINQSKRITDLLLARSATQAD